MFCFFQLPEGLFLYVQPKTGETLRERERERVCACVCECVSFAKILDIHSEFLPCLGQLDCHVLDSSGHLKVCFRGSVLFFFVCRKEKLEQEAKSSAERFEEVIMGLSFFVVQSAMQ